MSHRHLLLNALQPMLEREARHYSQWHEPEDLVSRARVLLLEPAFLVRRLLVLKGPNRVNSQGRNNLETEKKVQKKAFRLLGMLRVNDTTLPDANSLADIAKLLIQIAQNDAKAAERVQKTYPIKEIQTMSDSRVEAVYELRKTPNSERMAQVMAALGKLKPRVQYVLIAFWLDRKLLPEDSAEQHCPDLAKAPGVAAIRQAYRAARELEKENPANTLNKAYSFAMQKLRRAMGIAALFLVLFGGATLLHERAQMPARPQLASKQCRILEPASEPLLASKQCGTTEPNLGLLLTSKQCRTLELEHFV
jgi:hypothetical protein